MTVDQQTAEARERLLLRRYVAGVSLTLSGGGA